MIRIVIADKSRTIRRMVSMLLQSERVNCLEADTGEKTIRLIEAHKPELVILGIDLPDTSGMKLSYEIKKRGDFHGISIIMLHGATDPVESLTIHNPGIDYFIQRPFQSNALISAVERCLRISLDAEPNDAYKNPFNARVKATAPSRESYMVNPFIKEAKEARPKEKPFAQAPSRVRPPEKKADEAKPIDNPWTLHRSKPVARSAHESVKSSEHQESPIDKTIESIVARELPAIVARELPAIVARELPAIVARELPAIVARELPAIVARELPAICSRVLATKETQSNPVIIESGTRDTIQPQTETPPVESIIHKQKTSEE